MLSPIQQKVTDYLRNKERPWDHDLLCFVGMIETGEAVMQDFYSVGGIGLVRAVENKARELDATR